MTFMLSPARNRTALPLRAGIEIFIFSSASDQLRARDSVAILSLEDTSPPWSADATHPECGHWWRRPRDSEPPGHGAHPEPMSRAAENHSGNPSWPASQPWWSAQGTKQRRPRHPVAPVKKHTATGGLE